MGLMKEYRRWKQDVVPDGIRRPFTFFRCLYALDTEEWKTAVKVALEMGISVNTVQGYLKIAYQYGMAERKLVPSLAYGGGRIYAYRLNKSHYRFKGVEW